jgi:hypothetical protein
MTKKIYAITAYYKDYMLYEVEANSKEEAKNIALEKPGPILSNAG